MKKVNHGIPPAFVLPPALIRGIIIIYNREI